MKNTPDSSRLSIGHPVGQGFLFVFAGCEKSTGRLSPAQRENRFFCDHYNDSRKRPGLVPVDMRNTLLK